MKLADLRNEINKLATRAVLEGEGSISCHENLATGPKYQHIEVDTHGYRAFRSNEREKFIKAIDHADARVLDIGCNMGVTSRYIASLGAREVIGIEYEPYFVAIANLINTSLGEETVRFLQRDATDPATYARIGRFDIVYSLSSFNYVQHVMPQVAGITDRYFVIETHRALAGTFARTNKAISDYFKYYRIMGFTDHGKSTKDHRIFAVYARRPQDLIGFPSYDMNYRVENWELDLENTKFGFLEAFFAVHDPRKCLEKRGKDASSGIMGVTYWEKLIEGYDHWLQGKPWQDNPYYRYLLAARDSKWPGGDILHTRDNHEYVLNRRFETFKRAADHEPEYPIKVRVQAGSKGTGSHVFTNGERYKIAKNDGIQASFDGIHRCFMYKYLNWRSIPAEVTFIP